MFLGHIAVGLASKPAAPRVSLGWLVAAPVLLDLLWPLFLLLGLESVRIDPGNTAVTPLDFVAYPYSHSFVMVLLWAVLFGALVGARHGRGAAVVVGAGVLSHWVLDVISHRPDLPLHPAADAPRVGLGLWNSLGATVFVEAALFAAGVWVYARATRPEDRRGRWLFWAFVGFLVLIYAGNLFGPPPPNPNAIAVAALAAWLLPLWAAWFDRHRTARERARRA